MNKAKIKRITGRTEFWIFLVLIIMCIAIQAVSGGQLFESNTVVTSCVPWLWTACLP